MRVLKNKIFVTAPSDSITDYGDELRLKNAIKNFEELGYDVELGATVTLKNKYDENEYMYKVKEIENAIKDDTVDVIISANGGARLFEIIPYIDFEKIRKYKPKIFQGFSDNSILTFLLNTVLDWKTIYAPCFPTFGYNELDETIYNNLEILKGNYVTQKSCGFYETNSYKKTKGMELAGYNLDTKNKIIELNKIDKFDVNGEMVGGCLDVLKNIIGTKYDDLSRFNKKGKKIWFIENCYMSVEDLEDCIVKMKNKKWFSNVSCFMLGRGKIGLDKEFNDKQNLLLKKLLSEYNVPIIANCDFGHVRPFNTIICGEKVYLSYNKNKYKLKFKK